MPTTYGNDIVYCLKSHCGVRGYCRQKWVLQVQIICKFSNERTCKRNKDVQGLSCGFEENQNSEDMTATADFRQMAQYIGLAICGLMVRTAFGVFGILWGIIREIVNGVFRVTIGVIMAILSTIVFFGFILWLFTL